MRMRRATSMRTAARAAALLAGLALGSVPGLRAVSAADLDQAVPAAVVDEGKPAAPLETAVLSGGCFWGMQAVFEHVNGVRRVWAGYAGGAASTAQYEEVSTGTTGHAESVQILFDPRKVSFG